MVVRRAILAPAGVRGEGRVNLLRTQALAALALAARSMGAELRTLKKDARDAPLPSGGWHWSLSHTSLADIGLVAASVSRSPVGVDAEAIQSPRPEIVETTLDALGQPNSEELTISPDIARVLGRAPRPFAAWADRNAAAFRA